jgi:DNA-binding HxlR family transcriptional regulator
MPAAADEPRNCAIADALDLIGEKWSLLVVRELFWDVHRFADIARNTGAPRDVLSDRLRKLVDAGLLEKRPYSDHPPRADYHLTRAGRDLAPVLAAIGQWGNRHMPSKASRPYVSHHDHEIDPKVEVQCKTCGERVA